MDAKRTVKYAGFWRRLAALIIDGLIMVLLIMIIGVLGFLPSVLMNNGSFSVVGTGIILLATLIMIVIALGYHPYFLTRPDGATPGKKVMGLVVVDKNNKYPISLGSALLREIVGRMIVDRLTLQLGNLLIIFDSKKQALHDKIGSTYVVHRESLDSNVIEHQEDQ
jgi:uncharacterized RDD family membrane protein YckC